MSDTPNTPNDYPTNPGQQPGYPQQPSYPPQQPGYPPQQPGYPPQQGYPQQPEYPPQPGYPQQPYTPPPTTPQPATPPPYQPSYVQQPGYPQQPQGGYSGQPYAPPPQPKKSNRGLFIGCGIALVVVLLICGGVGIAAYAGALKLGDAAKTFGTAADAAVTVTAFCGDMQTQQYGLAYQQLSSGAQSKQTQAQFVKAMQDRDTKDGAIVTCAPVKADAFPTINGSSATSQIQVARGDSNSVKTGTLTLVQEGNNWKVDSTDSSLDLF